jgi:ABC-2 type transport system permease protein
MFLCPVNRWGIDPMSLSLTTLKNAMWIGWELEYNWTKKWVYFLYASIRPLSLCLILYFIYKLIATDPAGSQGFVSIFVGNAFFSIFIAVAGGISWVVIMDREEYRIIRYIYVAPMPFWWYMLGRATVILLVSLSSLTIILTFGAVVLGMPIGLTHISWPLLIPATILGVVSAAAFGLLFAGLCLVTARHSMLMAEGAGAIFLLACGVLFPVDFLPSWMQPVGMALPMTYWMEIVRRSFGGISFSHRLAAFSTTSLLVILFVLTILFCAAAFGGFKLCETHAKRTGKLDQTTNY